MLFHAQPFTISFLTKLVPRSATGLEGSVYHSVNRVSFDLRNNLPEGTEVTSNNIHLRIMIADKNASSEDDGYKSIAASSKYVDNNTFHLELCKTGSKENSLDHEHPFVNNKEYVVKLEVELAGVKQSSSFTFIYYETLPSFDSFNITQASGSTDFTVSGLVMKKLPGNLIPAVMSVAFDEIDISPNKNLADVNAVVSLYMNGDGSGAVVGNVNKLLPNSGSASVNGNNGYYRVLTSEVSELASKKNTGYFVSASAVLGNGYAHSFSSTVSKKVFNLEPVNITHVGAYDATTSDESTLTQQLMSIMLNTVDSGSPLWGVYTPSSVNFKLSDDNGAVFTCSKSYLNTLTNNVNPTYTILVKDMTPQVSGDSLKNGVNYQLEVTVNWVNGVAGQPNSAMSSTSRSSVWSSPVIFSQGIEPLIDLTMYNAWVAISKDNSELITESVPNRALIASVRKNGQFDSGIGTDNLDVDGTKFKLEIKVGDGAWTNVKSASIAQTATISGGVDANIRNAANAVFSTPLVELVDGKIDIPPTLGGVGTSQPALYLFIPSHVNYELPDSSTIPVQVRVSTYAGPDNSSYTPSFSQPTTGSVYVQAKPDVYTHEKNGEPVVNPITPFTATSSVPVNNNGVSSTLLDANIVADSNFAMITKTNQGWLVKADGTTITTYPGYPRPATVNKVNMYFYSSAASGVQQKVADVNQGVGLYTLFDFKEGATNYPFINAYTAFIPGGAVPSINKASWYNEAYVWWLNVPTLPSGQSVYGMTVIYTGSTPPNPLPPGVEPYRCLQASLITVNQRYFPVDDPRERTPIFLAGVSTDSGAPQKVNFNMAAAGISGPNYNWTVNFGLTYSAGVTASNDDPNLAGVKVTYVTPITGVQGSPALHVKNTYADLQSSPLTIVGLAGNSTSYKIQKAYKDVNKPGSYIFGQSSSVYTYQHKGVPTIEDFAASPLAVNDPGVTILSNLGYKSYNSNGESSISFNLSLNPRSYTRIDGVLVYFESTESNIPKTKIAVLKTSGDKTLQLLGTNGLLSSLGWNNYTSGKVTLTAYRDARAISANAEDVMVSNASVSNDTVYNIPIIPLASTNGIGVILTGGIICNASTIYTTSLNWTRDTSQPFTYKVTLTNVTNSGSADNMTVDNRSESAVLSVDNTNIYTYSATINKIFWNQQSASDTIVFSTAIVNTSNMAVTVLNPSTDSSLSVSWVSYTSQAGTAPNPIVPQFPANIVYMALVDTSYTPYVRINPNGNSVESTSGVYSINQYNLGAVLNLGVAVRANVNYYLNGNFVSTLQSAYTALNMTPNITVYTVSTIPRMSLSMNGVTSTSTIVVEYQKNNPAIALNLDAMGQENQGFISLVLVLTQDGTPSNPSGVEVLVQFPSNPSSANPFTIQNNTAPGGPPVGNLTGTNVAGWTNTISVTPLGLSYPSGTGENYKYNLTIGPQGTPANPQPLNPTNTGTGKFSWSYLTLPRSAYSGFQNGQEMNIMGILTTSRGTDIMIGSVMYYDVLQASQVSVNTSSGLYYVSFTLS